MTHPIREVRVSIKAEGKDGTERNAFMRYVHECLGYQFCEVPVLKVFRGETSSIEVHGASEYGDRQAKVYARAEYLLQCALKKARANCQMQFGG